MTFGFTPAAIGVETLERKTDRIHDAMTGCASRIGTMQRQLVTQGFDHHFAASLRQLKCRYIRWWLRWYGSEDVFNHPHATLDGRGAEVLGESRTQEASLTQDAASLVRLRPELHAPELRDRKSVV